LSLWTIAALCRLSRRGRDDRQVRRRARALRRVESSARRVILHMSTQLAAHALLATSERFRLAPRIIFHAGTPKTGTTSLQLFMDRNRDALLDRGVLYPRAGVLPPPEPKHHWIVTSLLNGDVANFTTMLPEFAGPAKVRQARRVIDDHRTSSTCNARPHKRRDDGLSVRP
jgi:hypothetical protein